MVNSGKSNFAPRLLLIFPKRHAACRRNRIQNPFTGRDSCGTAQLTSAGMGEFLIAPDGCRITGRQDDGAHEESFRVYLLGQALSYALVKQRLEPIHATAIVVNQGAAMFSVAVLSLWVARARV